ncbi:MAG: hypothetical protein GF410_11240 [Chitinivibrionales bacterium]|nr:hypothetical protein [Chitinivibrionales bacterium]
MKTTRYFDFRRTRPDRAMISDEWIKRVIENPLCRKVQRDGRIKLWGKIEEAEGKYLRVILLSDGETVHNSFFDRSFREKES